MDCLNYVNEDTAYLKQVLDDYKFSNEHQNIEDILDFAIKVIVFGKTNVSYHELSCIQTEIYAYLLNEVDQERRIGLRKIINLMVKNNFDDCVSIISQLDSNTQRATSKCLKEIAHSENNSNVQFFQFIFHVYIDLIDKEKGGIDNIEYIELKNETDNYLNKYFDSTIIDLSSFVNKVLDKLYYVIGIQESYQNDDLLEQRIKQMFLSNSKIVENYLKILNKMVNLKPNIQKCTKLNSLCYLLSFLSNYDDIDKLLTDNILQVFKSTLSRLYGLEFDGYFIMMHKLFGYKRIFDQKISDEQIFNQITVKDILVFEILQTEINGPQNLFKLLLILDHVQDETLTRRLECLFWTVFDGLQQEEKSKMIHCIYESRILSKHPNGNLRSLDYSNYHQNVQTILNKLSKNSINDEEVIKIYKTLN
jgi:hypothetical protein